MKLRIITTLALVYAVGLRTVCIAYIGARWYAVVYVFRMLTGEL
jgi:hypothetical protein